jgi:hypothetical protein
VYRDAVRWWSFALLAACRFTPGELTTGDGGRDSAGPVDGPTDMIVDDGNLASTCYARWLDDSIRFGEPVALDTVNSSVFDRDPFLSPDELTLWFSSGRTGGMGGSAPWVATRATTTMAFSTPILAAELDSPGVESKLSITADGLIAVIGSDRSGGSGSIDVWETQRANVTTPWPAPTRARTLQVNTSGADHDPTISADGLRLYLAPAGVGAQRIQVATRSTATAEFGAPVTIAELDSNMGDADPSPTPDERIMLLSSARSGGPQQGNVWYATRATSTGTFSSPRLVPDINTDDAEGDPHLSTDGCRIYFARSLGGNNYDLYMATALPP